ncbi:TPM domain-containing protein [Lysobacter sp. GX 14042]|uniref:TPM domain-containing protein n=1 Tax=Lysobacter sp. GX 14042 TaxID=2907155 RepID=UPI001F3A9EE5|nr:TPM domain-containing protein [Lysobacter sp. GX 14042]MCE7031090.1 TPM domain-containing protein [Lysobacter sp. GX 14042]
MRLLRHLFAPSARTLFPAGCLEEITRAIATAEQRHRGEICFAVEASLPAGALLSGLAPATRARQVFGELGVWDTELNSGVLVYLLLADHHIEIVADRGYRGKVDDAQWRQACDTVAAGLREGQPGAGILRAVEMISAHMERHFPQGGDGRDEDELPNRPHLL